MFVPLVRGEVEAASATIFVIFSRFFRDTASPVARNRTYGPESDIDRIALLSGALRCGKGPSRCYGFSFGSVCAEGGRGVLRRVS